MIGQRPPGNESHHHKTQDCEPRGRAVLLCSLALLLSTWVPFPIKSLALSARVSLDNSFPSVRQEPNFGPWKGVPLPTTVAADEEPSLPSSFFSFPLWKQALLLCSLDLPMVCQNFVVVVVYSLSPVRPFVTPWTTAHQAPLSMEFPRQEYRSRLPFPSPGNHPNPGIELASPALQTDSLMLRQWGSPCQSACLKLQLFTIPE